MKKLTILLCSLGLFLASSAYADEMGLMVGGGADLDDSYDAISFTAFYSGARAHNGQPIHFYSPLTFNLGVSLPGNLKTYAIQYTPSVEYDIRLMGNEFFGGPILGLGVFYQRTTGGTAKLNQLGVAIVPGIQFKYFVTDNILLRLVPVQFQMIPWTYTDNGVGSDILFALQYQGMAGVSFMF